MSDPVRLTIVSNELEAELVCGVLRSSGFVCMSRITDIAFGGGGEMPLSGAGPREVLVRPEDLAATRELLETTLQDAADAQRPDADRAER